MTVHASVKPKKLREWWIITCPEGGDDWLSTAPIPEADRACHSCRVIHVREVPKPKAKRSKRR